MKLSQQAILNGMQRSKPSRQQGAVLFISLMFLIILTLIGISAANVSIMQERMAGNVRDSNVAFQRAEASLREIEKRLRSISSTGGSGGLGVIPIWSAAQADLGMTRNDCTLSTITIDGVNDSQWTDTPGFDALPAAQRPEYIVIELSGAAPGGGVAGSVCRPIGGEWRGAPLEDYTWYLVVSRASGPTGNAESVVQAIYF